MPAIPALVTNGALNSFGEYGVPDIMGAFQDHNGTWCAACLDYITDVTEQRILSTTFNLPWGITVHRHICCDQRKHLELLESQTLLIQPISDPVAAGHLNLGFWQSVCAVSATRQKPRHLARNLCRAIHCAAGCRQGAAMHQIVVEICDRATADTPTFGNGWRTLDELMQYVGNEDYVQYGFGLSNLFRNLGEYSNAEAILEKTGALMPTLSGYDRDRLWPAYLRRDSVFNPSIQAGKAAISDASKNCDWYGARTARIITACICLGQTPRDSAEYLNCLVNSPFKIGFWQYAVIQFNLGLADYLSGRHDYACHHFMMAQYAADMLDLRLDVLPFLSDIPDLIDTNNPAVAVFKLGELRPDIFDDTFMIDARNEFLRPIRDKLVALLIGLSSSDDGDTATIENMPSQAPIIVSQSEININIAEMIQMKKQNKITATDNSTVVNESSVVLNEASTIESNSLLHQIVTGSFISGLVFGILGVVLVALGSSGETQFNFLGQSFRSTNVGIASIFLGACLIFLSIRRALKSYDKSNQP